MRLTGVTKKGKTIGFSIKKTSKRDEFALNIIEGDIYYPVAYFRSETHARKFKNVLKRMINPPYGYRW
jgi:hypothetical protein